MRAVIATPGSGKTTLIGVRSRQMVRWTTLAVVVVVVGVLAGVAAPEANASCTRTEPREQLATNPAAFVGVLDSVQPEGSGGRTYTFRVERAIKGELGPVVEIRERAVTSVNLTDVAVGQRVGLVLQSGEEGWSTNECNRFDPDELIAAAAPIPIPPGTGRAAFLVAGTFGSARLIALDRSGQPLAYGLGTWAHSVSVCPRSRLVVELSDRFMTVRRLRDMQVVRSRRVPLARDVICRDRRARRIVMFAVRGTQASRLLSLRRNRLRTLHRTTASGVTFTRRSAYLRRGDRGARIDAVDLSSGTRQHVATLRMPTGAEGPQSIAVSRDGSRLAAVLPLRSAEEGRSAARLVVVDRRMAPARVRTLDIGGSDTAGEVVWLGANRLAFVPATCDFRGCPDTGTMRLFDAHLDDQGAVVGWTGALPVALGSRVFALRAHLLVSARVPGGPLELHGGLPSSGASQLIALPRAVEISGAPRNRPRYGASGK